MADETNEPWWRKGILAALIAAVIPVATLIQGWMHRERELRLQQEETKQELRVAYANLMVVGGMEKVAQLARFIASTEPEGAIKDWAMAQQDEATKSVAALEQRLAEAERALAVARTKEAEAIARARKAEEKAKRVAQKPGIDDSSKDAAQASADEARKVAAAAALESDKVAATAERTRTTLTGPKPADVESLDAIRRRIDMRRALGVNVP